MLWVLLCFPDPADCQLVAREQVMISLSCRAVKMAYESHTRMKDLEQIAEHEVRVSWFSPSVHSLRICSL